MLKRQCYCFCQADDSTSALCDDLIGPKKRTDVVKAHFEGDACTFDGRVAKAVPHYGEMLEALVSGIPFPSKAEIDIIDLGCGTGNLSSAVRKKFPNAQITCLDLSEKMIALSRRKLGENKTTYVTTDLSGFEFNTKYDAIISSLALHYLEKNERKRFFLKVYEALKEGGVFLNADVVLASTNYWQRTYLQKEISFLRQSQSEEEITEAYEKYEDEDRPVVLLDDLHLLEEISFKKPDVLWKYYNFAVYGASKLTTHA